MWYNIIRKKRARLRKRSVMANSKIHFEVAVEGFVQWFNSFNEARDEYNALRECGFYEAVLRRVCEGEPTVCWDPLAGAFIA